MIRSRLEDDLPNLPQPFPDALRFYCAQFSQLLPQQEVKIQENVGHIVNPDVRHRKNFKVDFHLPDTAEVLIKVKELVRDKD
jgi:hypothetical protein